MPEAPPNIIFIISDDHSYPDLGCYGNEAVRTPNLDRMASEGMRFDHCFVSSPQCSPNRSSIFTGCSPHTTATTRLHTPLPPWEQSFLEPLKERGYFAGAFRKVHQGAEFDKRWDYYGSAKEPFDKFFDALPKGRPFFLHVGFTEPHRPYQRGRFSPRHDPKRVKLPAYLPDAPAIREDLADYYDEIAHMDAEIGGLFELLSRRGLSGNTLVMFTGDNGMPFPRAKGACYDAGIRVPLLAWWPGRIAAGGARRDLISHVDLPVTWLAAAGISKPPRMQGRNFLGLLTGGTYQPREAAFSERNWHNTFDPIRCVRTARYKLIYNAAPRFPYRPPSDLEASPTWQEYLLMARRGQLSETHQRLLDPARPLYELFDLERDPGEFYNLGSSQDHAGVLQEHLERLSDWMHETYDFLPPPFEGYPAREKRGRAFSI